MTIKTAMILSAGRGERMGQLTQNKPKPLLKCRKKTLLEWHLEKLSDAGFTDVIINVSYLASQIEDYVGDGAKWNINITISREDPILETAGGIKKALSLINPQIFVVINADIFTEFDYKKLVEAELLKDIDAHLYLTENPTHNRDGDFTLNKEGFLRARTSQAKTFTGIGVYKKLFFDEVPINSYAKLAPLINRGIKKNIITGELLNSFWTDVGTPERLNSLNEL